MCSFSVTLHEHSNRLRHLTVCSSNRHEHPLERITLWWSKSRFWTCTCQYGKCPTSVHYDTIMQLWFFGRTWIWTATVGPCGQHVKFVWPRYCTLNTPYSMSYCVCECFSLLINRCHLVWKPLPLHEQWLVLLKPFEWSLRPKSSINAIHLQPWGCNHSS